MNLTLLTLFLLTISLTLQHPSTDNQTPPPQKQDQLILQTFNNSAITSSSPSQYNTPKPLESINQPQQISTSSSQCTQSQTNQQKIKTAYIYGLIWGILFGVVFSWLIKFCLENRNKMFKNISKTISSANRDRVVRCLIVGDAEVGKSSILQRICNQPFNEQYIPTIGAHFKIKELQNEKLMIWDTAGQQKYKITSFSYIKGLKIFYIVYSCQSRDSFSKIPQIIEELRENHEEFQKGFICIVGNKMDGEKREVSEQEGEELAKKYRMGFIEVSAKNNKNIQKLYEEASEWLQNYQHLIEDQKKQI